MPPPPLDVNDPKYWATVINGVVTPSQERLGITSDLLFIRSETRDQFNKFRIAYVERLPDTDQSGGAASEYKVMRCFELMDYPSRVELHRFCASLVGYPFVVKQEALTEQFMGLHQAASTGVPTEQPVAANRTIDFFRVGRHLPHRIDYLETYGTNDGSVYSADNGNFVDVYNTNFLHATKIENCIGRGARGSTMLGTNVSTRVAIGGHADFYNDNAPGYRPYPQFETYKLNVVFEMLPFASRTRINELAIQGPEYNRYVVKRGRTITETITGSFNDPSASQIVWDPNTLSGEPPTAAKYTDPKVPVANQNSRVVSSTDIEWTWYDVPGPAFSMQFIEAAYGRINALDVISEENGEFITYKAGTLLFVHCNRTPSKSISGRPTWNLTFRFIYKPNYGTDGVAKGHNWFINPYGYFQRVRRKNFDDYYRSFHFPDLFRRLKTT